MYVNTDSLIIRAAPTSTSGTLNDLRTDLTMENNNKGRGVTTTTVSCLCALHIKVQWLTRSLRSNSTQPLVDIQLRNYCYFINLTK